jgi:hypothetical protein
MLPYILLLGLLPAVLTQTEVPEGAVTQNVRLVSP